MRLRNGLIAVGIVVCATGYAQPVVSNNSGYEPVIPRPVVVRAPDVAAPTPQPEQTYALAPRGNTPLTNTTPLSGTASNYAPATPCVAAPPSATLPAYAPAPPRATAPPRQIVYRDDRNHHHHKRSGKKSAAIVVGSAGVGAAVGALAGGGKGAGIGALAGGAGGFVYDRLTHNH